MPETHTTFQVGDRVTPKTKLRGINFPIGVVGVVLAIHEPSGQIAVGVEHSQLCQVQTNTGFPPKYIHRLIVYQDRLSKATLAAA